MKIKALGKHNIEGKTETRKGFPRAFFFAVLPSKEEV